MSRSISKVKIVLILSYISIIVGILAARQNPAVGYELSIYSETPIYVWVLLFGAIFGFLLCWNTTNKNLIRCVSLFGLATTIFTIASLRIVRGYYFIGKDALSRLGTTEAIMNDDILMNEWIYPGSGSVSIFITQTAGIDLRHSVMIMMAVVVVVYIIFVTLTVRTVVGNTSSILIGLVSASFLFPLNQISVGPSYNPTFFAIMFSPLVLYSVIKLIKSQTSTFYFVSLAGSAALVLFHPQQAVHMLLFLTGFVIMYPLITKEDLGTDSGKNMFSSRGITFPFAFGLVWWLWVSSIDRFESHLGSLVVRVLSFDEESTTQTSTRTSSLEAVGGGVPELFLKIFSITLVYSVLTSVAIILALYLFLNGNTKLPVITPKNKFINRFFICSTVGYIVMGIIFVLYFLRGGDQYMRTFGFISMIITVTGSIYLSQLSNCGIKLESGKIRAAASVIVLILLIVSTLTMFNSPWIYQSTNHVAESEVEGYETIFTYTEKEGEFLHTFDAPRGGVSLYGVQHFGPRTFDRSEFYREGVSNGGVPDNFADRELNKYFGEDVYFITTKEDYQNDVINLNGLRFSEDDFEYLYTQPNHHQTYNNGDVEKLFIENANPQ